MKTRDMKTNQSFLLLFAAVLVIAAGCGNNSSNAPATTNAVSGALPATNEMENNPPAMGTNALMGTNSMMGTNAVTGTNSTPNK